MSPEVIAEKLSSLAEVLEDLKPHVSSSQEELESAHYEIERQVQLCVDLATAIGRRMLTLNGKVVPPSAREVFTRLKEGRMISRSLATSLEKAVGLRNLLVHEYGRIDYDRFFGGLAQGYKAFVTFAEAASRFKTKLSKK